MLYRPESLKAAKFHAGSFDLPNEILEEISYIDHSSLSDLHILSYYKYIKTTKNAHESPEGSHLNLSGLIPNKRTVILEHIVLNEI
jgi:hypothetical protein